MKNNRRMNRAAWFALLAAFAFVTAGASQALAYECEFPSGRYAFYGFPALGANVTQPVSCAEKGNMSGYARSWNLSDYGKALQVEWYEGTTCNTSPNNCAIRAEGYNRNGIQTCAVHVSSAGTTSFNYCPNNTTKWKAFVGSTLQ